MIGLFTEDDPMALTARNAINISALTETAQQTLPTTVMKNEIR